MEYEGPHVRGKLNYNLNIHHHQNSYGKEWQFIFSNTN
jgi:hypothetical protein